MFTHILVATDGSELSHKAEATGLQLARSLGAKLSYVTVRIPFQIYTFEVGVTPDVFENYEAKTKASAQEILNRVTAQAAAVGLKATTHELTSEFPYEVILDLAKTQSCDLIVMASHGRRGLSAMLLGSETTKLLTHSSLPVLVCK